MEVYRLDKAINNKKLDLELAIGKLKKAKEKLSQSLKRRKYLALQMNDNLYKKELKMYILKEIHVKLMQKSKSYCRKIQIFKRKLES